MGYSLKLQIDHFSNSARDENKPDDDHMIIFGLIKHFLNLQLSSLKIVKEN